MDGGLLILTIALLVAVTVAVAARLLAPAMAQRRVVFRSDPDGPIAFGPDMAWLAIRTRDIARVVQALGLSEITPCNWASGIGTIYDSELGQSHVFVSPPVGKWIFVAGLCLPHPMPRTFTDTCMPLLVRLAGRFPEVQYYFSFPLIDFFAWARMQDGRLMRAFAIGDEGIVWSKGRTTRDETSLGLKLFELRGVKGRRGDAGGEIILHPTEDHVMRLASRWSLDPTSLNDASAGEALGYIALAPAQWRAQRHKKAA